MKQHDHSPGDKPFWIFLRLWAGDLYHIDLIIKHWYLYSKTSGFYIYRAQWKTKKNEEDDDDDNNNNNNNSNNNNTLLNSSQIEN